MEAAIAAKREDLVETGLGKARLELDQAAIYNDLLDGLVM